MARACHFKQYRHVLINLLLVDELYYREDLARYGIPLSPIMQNKSGLIVTS